MKENYYTNDVNGDLERAQDRITELEALIRDVFIPDVQGIRETAGKPEDTHIETKVLEIKLREAIK